MRVLEGEAMGITVGELAEHIGARLRGEPTCVIERVATLSNAGPGSVSFLANPRYGAQLASTLASAVILAEAFEPKCPSHALVLDNPYLGYARAAALLNPSPPVASGRHPSASVAPTAEVDPSAWIGPHGVVGAGVRVGARSYVGPGCVLEDQVVVGDDVRLSANVTLCREVRIGDRVLIHPGVVIGADGFGIANDDGRWVKVPQLGSVRVGDDVEIGANTTIDRGALEDTVIEVGVKIDNLVQIGHNVHIGAHTAIAGCAGIAGSARIGKRCTIGGAATIGGHLEIADDVHLTATTGVPNSIDAPGYYSSGTPPQETRLWRRNVARWRHLDEMARRLKALERKLE